MARTATGRPRSLGRLSEIAHVAARHGFGYVFARNRTNGDELEAVSDRGRRLREMLEELGPTFVKFGQLLSTRPDVVPPDIVVELRRLQDDVAPFSYVLVREVVEAELGLTIDRAFLEFDLTPIASASIGQVHRAVLPDGTEVAVKVQRPTARTQIEADLGLLYQAAKLLRETKAKLIEVAQGVGYESEAAFSRAFKRTVGVAPGAWRAGHRPGGTTPALAP